jgi:cell division protein FtsA
MKANQTEHENHIPDLLESLRLFPSEESGRHLTDAEFVGYLMIDEHLANCQECAEEMQRLIEAAEVWRSSDLESKRLELLGQIKNYGESSMAEPKIQPRARADESQSSHEAGSVEIRHRETWQKESKTRDHLVAVDIGSSKVAVLVGKRADQGGVVIIGKGVAPSSGTRKGSIANVETVVEALKHASAEARLMSGVDISRAYVSFSDPDVRSISSHGVISITANEITHRDIRRVLEAAKSGALSLDREVVHILPQFIVDDQSGIVDPVGMPGSRLEVSAHLVTANINRMRTLLSCINRAGIEVAEFVFEPLAAAEALCTSDERELGVFIIDIGAGTTQLAYFSEGELQYCAVIPIGAGHFTSDLSMVLRTPLSEAERLKVTQGCCLPSMVTDEENIAGGDSRVVSKRELCEILQPRAEELLHLIRMDLIRHTANCSLRGGVVLTGGGANLDGLLALAEQIFDSGVRYGLPRGLRGATGTINNMSWSTVSGLLLFAAAAEANRRQGQPKPSGFSVRNVMSGLRGMFLDRF